MEIKLKNNLLLIKKHKNTKLAADMVVEESEEDKKLITGEILQSGSTSYNVGETVIFGKYALLCLTLKGVDYYILDVDDVIGVCNYFEKDE